LQWEFYYVKLDGCVFCPGEAFSRTAFNARKVLDLDLSLLWVVFADTLEIVTQGTGKYD